MGATEREGALAGRVGGADPPRHVLALELHIGDPALLAPQRQWPRPFGSRRAEQAVIGGDVEVGAGRHRANPYANRVLTLAQSRNDAGLSGAALSINGLLRPAFQSTAKQRRQGDDSRPEDARCSGWRSKFAPVQRAEDRPSSCDPDQSRGRSSSCSREMPRRETLRHRHWRLRHSHFLPTAPSSDPSAALTISKAACLAGLVRRPRI